VESFDEVFGIGVPRNEPGGRRGVEPGAERIEDRVEGRVQEFGVELKVEDQDHETFGAGSEPQNLEDRPWTKHTG